MFLLGLLSEEVGGLFVYFSLSLSLSTLLDTPQNAANFNVKGFHNPPLVNNPVLANRGHSHTQYHRNTWRRRKRDSLPVSLSR